MQTGISAPLLKNRDWEKINYGAWLKWSNFRGRNELLTAKVRLGYVKEYSLAYSKPNLGKKQNHGISFGFNANQQNEVSVSTVNNMPFEYRPEDVPAQIRLNAFTIILTGGNTIPRIVFALNIWISGCLIRWLFSTPNYLGEGDTRQNILSLTYNFDYDIRDSKVYPLEGFRVKIKAEQIGLGLISDFAYPTFA